MTETIARRCRLRRLAPRAPTKVRIAVDGGQGRGTSGPVLTPTLLDTSKTDVMDSTPRADPPPARASARPHPNR
jgi:hypothetical protein